MAKAVVSGGGGGSNGAPVKWEESILAAIQDSKPHPDAVCAMSLLGADATAPIKRRFRIEMERRADTGEALSALGTYCGKCVRWYWPNPKFKP